MKGKIFVFSIIVLLIISGFLVVVEGKTKYGEEINGGVEELQQGAYFHVEINDYDDNVTVNDNITVEFAVENVGDAEGTQDIIFSVDGDILATENSLTLSPGQVYTGEFILEPKVEGEYDLTVSSEDDGETVTVKVREEENGEILNEEIVNEEMGMIIVIFLILISIGIVIYIVYRKRTKERETEQDDWGEWEPPEKESEEKYESQNENDNEDRDSERESKSTSQPQNKQPINKLNKQSTPSPPKKEQISQQQQQSAQESSSRHKTPKEKLEELQELKEDGLISEEDYEKKKDEILDQY